MRGIQNQIICVCFYNNINLIFIYRLYFGGHWPINIKTIRIRQTNENFCKFIRPLLYLDSLLNGADPYDVKGINILLKDIQMILYLMEWKLGQKPNNKYPQYVFDTFKCFCNHKKQISLVPS